MSINEENNLKTSTGEDSPNNSDTPRQHIPKDLLEQDSLEYGREVNKRAMELLAERKKRKGLIP